METVTNKPALHTGHKIERLRTVIGISQAELGARLDITKQSVSKMEQAEAIEDDRLQKIAQALGISAEAINNFNEGALLFHIQHMHDHSTAYAHNFQCSYNPLDKVVELYERLLQVEREKVELLKCRLADSQTRR
jgi:transcriptional regulator with XRE-family HTH domain